MDKKGFDHVDRQYQQELAGHKQKIIEKWEGFYANKKYVGTPEMQAKARANDNAQKKLRINAELSTVSQRVGKAHFGDKGREDTLKEVQRQEEIRQKAEQLKKDFERNSNDHDRGGGGR